MELAGKGILWVLWEIFGVDIQSIEFASITTIGKEYETAAAKKWSAEREKERIEIEASADAKRIDIIAEAEAKKIKTVAEAITAQGEVGLALKAMDTIEKASAKPGNWMFFPSNLLSPLADLFKKTGGQDKEKEGGDKK